MCLAPGVTIESAGAGLDAITRNLDEQDPSSLVRTDKGRGVTLLPAGTNVPMPGKLKPALIGFLVALMTHFSCSLSIALVAGGDEASSRGRTVLEGGIADPTNQGSAALESVFHETSHDMMGKVRDSITDAEADLNAHRSGAAFHSRAIWHAVLFYTAGELVAEQIPGYTPYSDKNGL
jgi:hypothetical protein